MMWSTVEMFVMSYTGNEAVFPVPYVVVLVIRDEYCNVVVHGGNEMVVGVLKCNGAGISVQGG